MLRLAIALGVLPLLGCGADARPSGADGPDAGDAGKESGEVPLDAATDVSDSDVDPLWAHCIPRHWTVGRTSVQHDYPPWPNSDDTMTTLLPDGRVLMGYGTAIYDPKTDTYEGLHSPEGRVQGAAVVMADKKSVLLSGGSDGGGGGTNHAYLLDLESKTFRRLPPMLRPHTDHASLALADGRAIVLGGTRVDADDIGAEVYDPATDSWSVFDVLPAWYPYYGWRARQLTVTKAIVEAGTCAIRILDTQTLESVPVDVDFTPSWFVALGPHRALVGGADRGYCSGINPKLSAVAAFVDLDTGKSTLAPDPPQFFQLMVKSERLPCGNVVLMGTIAGFQTEVQLFDVTENRWFDLGSPSVYFGASSTSQLLPDGRIMVTWGGPLYWTDVSNGGAPAFFTE